MDIRIAATLDITGDRCPMTFVKVKLNLEELLLEAQGERHRMLVRKEK